MSIFFFSKKFIRVLSIPTLLRWSLSSLLTCDESMCSCLSFIWIAEHLEIFWRKILHVFFSSKLFDMFRKNFGIDLSRHSFFKNDDTRGLVSVEKHVILQSPSKLGNFQRIWAANFWLFCTFGSILLFFIASLGFFAFESRSAFHTASFSPC